MNTIVSVRENGTSKLKACIMSHRLSFIYEFENQRKRITKLFEEEIMSVEVVERVLLSCLAGADKIKHSKKSREVSNRTFDSDIYFSAETLYDIYCKHTAVKYQRHIKFLTALAGALVRYREKYYRLRDGLGQFEQSLMCNMIASLIKNISLPNRVKLSLTMWMCEIMEGNFDLQHQWDKFIINQYCSIFSGMFSESQKKIMENNSKNFWEWKLVEEKV